VDATAEGRPVKEPKDVDTVDKDLLDAASAVAGALHEHDNEMKKRFVENVTYSLTLEEFVLENEHPLGIL
jgi:hypothetical protein